MREIRIHGRGGQGSLVLAELIATAALHDGKFGQAFPFLGGGGERRGKPIMAFCRLSAQPIRARSRVSRPDYVIVQDTTILGELDVAQGIKEGGAILLNTEKGPEEFGLKGLCRVHAFPAEGLARRILGRPIMNTALLGAFAAITKELSLEAALKAVRSKFPGQLGDKNVRIVQESYQQSEALRQSHRGRSHVVESPGVEARPAVVGSARGEGTTRVTLGGVVQGGTSLNYQTGRWREQRPVIQTELCKACGMCEMVCPDNAINVVDKLYSINYTYCKGCALCAYECPTQAVLTQPEAR